MISSVGDAPGIPAIDRDICNNCGACAKICPVNVLSETPAGIVIDNTNAFGCIACGQCMMVCPLECVVVTGRKASPDDLVSLPLIKERATAGQLEALLLARRSIRSFSAEDVPREVIERVVAAAATAPMGIPPWEAGITVFHGRNKVSELARDTVESYGRLLKIIDNPLARTLCRIIMKKTVWQQFESFILPLGRALVEGKERGKDYVLYDAPAALLFHVSPYADGADAFIACTYAMIAAHSLGLGTCMIGCAAPVLGRSGELMKRYGLPEGNTPKIVLIMGYCESPHRRAIRRRFQSVTYY